MFNIGFFELVIIAIIGLIVIGPEQLPDLARKLARLMNDLKRAKEEVFRPVEDMKQEAQKFVEKVRKETQDQINAATKAAEQLEKESGFHDEDRTREIQPAAEEMTQEIDIYKASAKDKKDV